MHRYVVLWLEVLLHYSAVKVFHIRHATGGGRPPLPFFQNKKMPWFWKKRPWFFPYWGLIYHSKYSLRVSRTKSSKIFCCGAFFSLIFRGNIYRSALISRNFPCPEKFLVVHLHIYDIRNLVFVHWNFIDSIYRNLGGLVVWYLKTWPGFDSQPGSILSTVNYLQLMIYSKKLLIKYRYLS